MPRANGARFLLASTSEVYGDPSVHPQPESYWGNVNPIGPRSVYDEAKRFGEAITMAYRRTYGVATRIVRIFNTYGPRLRAADGRVVSNFLAQAMEGRPITIYGKGTQTRSFCYVEDEVRGLLALLDSDETDPVNIGNPTEFTMLELAELVLELTDAKSTIVHEALPIDDPQQRRPDITRARAIARVGNRPCRCAKASNAHTGGTSSRSVAESPARWAAVVVNYESGPLLRTAVESLLADESAGMPEVVVVDNGSRDGSVTGVDGLSPGVRVVTPGENVGYAAAANFGISRTVAPVVVVCNPDLVVAPGTAGVMVGRIDAEHDIAALGPQIRNPDGSIYPSARTQPSLVDAVGHALLGTIRPENRFTRRYRQLDEDPEAPRDVEWVSGAMIWLRRSAVASVGGWDDAYFMYVEDVDLCWRLRRLGWRIVYEPAGHVVHVQGASADHHPYRTVVAHHRSLYRFAAKRWRGPRRLLLPLAAAFLFLRASWIVLLRALRLGRE